MPINPRHPACVRMFSLAIALCTTAAQAGPEWPEIPDAGNLPGTAQPVTGNGVVTKINGQLQGIPPLPDRGLGGDFQDMYLINIVDPNAFLASTDVLLGGFCDFPSALYLFNIDGFGIVASQGLNPGDPAATINGQSTDGSGSMLVAPGLYLLAISGRSSFPLAGPDLDPIFEFVMSGEISGPDGPGGNAFIEDWSGPGEIGPYSIVLQGVAFLPLPCPADLNHDGQLDFFDVLLFLQAFSNHDPRADFVPDGTFDFFDVLAFLQAFSNGCP